MPPLHLSIRDATTGEWLRFGDPVRVLVAQTPEGVPSVLEAVDAAVAAGGWVAGFLAYEAAPGLDPALRARRDSDFPAVVFGVFDPPGRLKAPAPPVPGGASTDAMTGPDPASYAEAIAHVKEAIRAGDTYQVNLTFRLRGGLRVPPAHLFRRLVAGQSATYGARCRYGDWDILSASPELLVARRAGRLSSRPMKSTAPRHPHGPEDLRAGLGLLASPKETAEHLMIVDMVRNDLSRVCVAGSVQVTDPFRLEAYPTVWQLTSLVEGQSDALLSEVLQAVFPGASITGAPKASTMGLIGELESTPRRIYTGSIGFAAPDGRMQFNVAIRTALHHRQSAILEYGVGGGVVWDSDPEAELKEAHLKAGILSVPSPEFSLLETMRLDPEDGIHLLERHLARLAQSARTLGYRFSRRRILARLGTIADPMTPLRVRLLLSRDGSVSVSAEPLTASPAFDSPALAIAPAATSSADPFLVHKTTHREHYRRMRALCPGCDDVVLWNERGEVTETTFSNLFLQRDGTLITPTAQCGLLPGTLRAELLSNGKASEAVLTPEDLLDADEIWLGNSVRGLYRVGSLRDDRPTDFLG